MFIQVLGIDLGKSNFHIVGHDCAGKTVVRKKLSRKQLIVFLQQLPPTTIAFEACGGAHWLGRLCQQFEHQVKLIPPQYVKPYVKGNKNDFIDADAIAEAAGRPSMRFVAVKTEAAQMMSAVHRVRQGYIKERTACMSRIGALLLEFGVSLPRGHSVMKQLFQWLAEHAGKLPAPLIAELAGLHAHYEYLSERIAEQDLKLKQQLATHGDAQLLKSIPGIGDITASQCVAELGNAEQFKNGRDLAAWLGLVPHQHSTGGKPRLLGISKRGNKHLRTLLIHGARAILSRPEKTGAVFGEWLIKLRATKPFNVVCVALANKLARIVWSVLRTKEQFNAAKLQPEFA